MAFKFEELRVWELSINLATEINGLIKTFPSEERFVLSSQIQRAADSVALNIAEGSTGQSNAEFKKIPWVFQPISNRSGLLSSPRAKKKPNSGRSLFQTLFFL
ncbi:four helix bundle protein [Algoriphagus alkaliphilus]|uniref:Four helix bundle protein n=1 Tax=Algoriphagus alkaliphilus TaxID=279824 RepID=A0A1G5UUG1_9BACT|nr:four helix bundle protein [Algoriphagus alkaliphilus]